MLYYNFLNTITRKKLIIFLVIIFMKDTIIQQCLDILKRDDVKSEVKTLCKPVIDLFFYEIYHYIYIIVALVFMIFIMILAILILLIQLLRNKSFFAKVF